MNLGDDDGQEAGEEPENADEDDDSSGVSDANQEVKSATDNEKSGSTIESMAQVTQDPAGKEDAKNIKNSKVESIYPEKDET